MKSFIRVALSASALALACVMPAGAQTKLTIATVMELVLSTAERLEAVRG